MKKYTKNILIILSCCLLSCSAAALATSCDNNSGNIINSGQQSQTAEISFSVSEKTLTIGDEEYLTPTYKRLSGYTLTYVSSNPTIVKVDESGKISAEGEGTATVTAIYSNGTSKAEASVLVTSTFGGYLPEIKTMGVENDVSITLNSSYVMLPYISFNNKQFNDMTVSYSIVDETIAEITADGEIIAKTKGSTKIFIEAIWRGKDKKNAPTMQKLINLSVIDDVRFYNDEKSVMDEALFVLGEFEGVSYKNSIPCDFTVMVNGEEKSANVTIENEEILGKQGDLLVAKSFGSTSVTVQANTEEETYVTSFEVIVKRVEKNIDSVVPLFSTVDGTYLDIVKNEKKAILSFIEKSDEAVDAYQGSKKLTVEDGKIYGVESSSETGRGIANISVGTSTILYSFNLETLAKVISKPEDLKALELSGSKILVGYYELVKNIDAADIEINHVTGNGANFAGVFNGNGYTISNLTLKQEQGLFGVLSSTAVVKNLALTNLNATEAYFLARDTLNEGVTMTDLYISLSEDTIMPRGITGRTSGNSVVKNVVIEYLGENAQANRNYSNSSWKWQGLIGGVWKYESDGNYYAQDKKWNDVYVISPFIVAFNPMDFTVNGTKNAAVYGYGVNETTDVYGNSLENSVHERSNPNLGDYFYSETYCNILFTNLYHYASYEALSTETNDFASFSSEYWVVYENKIMWKSMLEKEIEVGLYDGEKLIADSFRIKSVGKTIDLKAYVCGGETTDIEVTVSQNDYLVWDSEKKAIKVIALPQSDLGIIEIKVIVKVGEAQFTKTMLLDIKSSTVQPVQPGGDYDAGDYEDSSEITVQPIQPGGDYDAGDYEE